MMKGYAGQLLYINLTEGIIQNEPLDPGMAKSFIGAPGFAFKMAYDLIKPNIDPLSSDNVVFFSGGPLTGTNLGTKFSSFCKLPLTGALAFGSGGMGFGARLKWAGYDQIAITGRSSKPVFLKIHNDNVEICDAEFLWGKDIYETTDALVDKLGGNYSIIAIGKSGENLVPMSVALVDKTSSIGKGGLPAVMGSKNLKAIAVRGSKPVHLYDTKKFMSIRNEILRKCEESRIDRDTIKLGKMWFALKWGYTPTYKSHKEVFSPERFEELYGEDVYFKEILGKRIGCTGCIYPCKDLVTLNTQPYKGLTTNISSIVGRVWNLGVQTSNGISFKKTIKLFDKANRLGVDTHTFAPVMMLAVELYEKGIITKKDTKGLELKADFQTTSKLLEQVALRQGIGDVLANGSYGIIEEFGEEVEDYSVHIKGLDQQIDARSFDFNMMVFSQVTNPEGGKIESAHIGSSWFPHTTSIKRSSVIEKVKEFCHRMDMDEKTVERVFNFPPGCYSTPITTRWAEDFYIALTAMGICEYRNQYLDWDIFSDLYHSATGIETTREEMKKAGERIWNLYKAINVREGFNRVHDRFPPKWLRPLIGPDGEEIPLSTCEGRQVTVETFNKMLDEYYDERGWNIKDGIPTENKLRELGLDEAANDLKRAGY